MNRETFNKGFALLMATFANSYKGAALTEEAYWQVLKEIPDDIFENGVMRCLAEQTYFPIPHELGVACCGETKEEVVTIEDPWAFNQFRKQRIEGVTWQQNLQKRLRLRKLIAEGLDKPKLEELVGTVTGEPPKKTAAELERELQQLQAKFGELDHRYEMLLQENFRLNRENDALKEKPKQTSEERRAQLKEQLKILNGNGLAEEKNEREPPKGATNGG